MKGFNIIILVIAIFSSVPSFGQKAMSRSLSVTVEEATTNARVGAFGEVIEIKEIEAEKQELVPSSTGTSKSAEAPKRTSVPRSKAVYFHTAKTISEETGYFIELIVSKEILDKEHKIYQEFGNLKVRENKNSEFCYLIGTFVTKDAADKFLNGVILNRYPNAQLVEMKKGKCK